MNLSTRIYVSLRSESLGAMFSHEYFEKLLSGKKLSDVKTVDYLTYQYVTGFFGGVKEPSVIIDMLRFEEYGNVLPEEIIFSLVLAARLTKYLGQLSVIVEFDLGDEIICVDVLNPEVEKLKKMFDEVKEKEADPRKWAAAGLDYFEKYNIRNTDVKSWLVKVYH